MSNKIKIYLCLFIPAIGLLLIASCKKESPYVINYEYNYYPLDSGHYVIYNVDSILYTYSAPVYTRDTAHYQLMEVIGDTFYDNQNRLNYELDYYRRPDSTYAWGSIDYVWYALLTTTNLQIIENDIRFIKLVFPPQLNVPWNGNHYVPTSTNPLDPYYVFQGWSYFCENLDTTYNFNGLIVNNALVVSEVNQASLINETIRTESYVQGIGLVYQQWVAASKQNVTTNWDTGAENGFSIIMRLWAHN